MQQYGDAVKTLSSASRRVTECAISYEADAFNRAWAFCHEAGKESSRSRHELHEHMAEHGCY
jgi:hypothetical protein